MQARCEMITRNASAADIPAVSALERAVWAPMGVTPYSPSHFATWLSVNPSCFIVAEHAGQILGYIYAHYVDFSFDALPTYASCDEATDFGYSRRTHNPSGNSMYVRITSAGKGAGRALNQALYEHARNLQKQHYVGHSRIAGFAAFLRRIEGSAIFGIIPPALEHDIALWYVHECAKLVHGRVWDVCPAQPRLELPGLGQPDPILGWHLKHWDLGVAGVTPKFMKDPQSRDYGVLVVWKFPWARS